MPNRPLHGLDTLGITGTGYIHWSPVTSKIYEEVIGRREGHIAHNGPLVVRTGHHTGRSPDDKFIVDEPSSRDKIWWGTVNRPISEENFNALFAKLRAYLHGVDLFVQDCYVGADPRYRIPIRVVSEYAWHSLFARNMFIRIDDPEERRRHLPEFTVIDCPKFHADPEVHGTHSESHILVNFGARLVLIGGTSYGGEIKKSVFTFLNYVYPQDRVLSMHCSCSVGQHDDPAVFFGLSGTGKTTLSADPHRTLVGDDEHGWSDDGVFNFEGGCYAKTIRLSAQAEPQIYKCAHKFGTVLENVGLDLLTRKIDLDDDTLTENTRAAYSVDQVANARVPGMCGHPKNVIMLTCDAFGVLPPIARMTPEQAMYHFLSGYTAKVAGTEKGVTEPQPTFSTCFGAPFMALPPSVYAELLGEKIAAHNVDCWLVNTGWTGGGFGVGQRMDIALTRAMVNAALNGGLTDVPTTPHPVFKVQVPASCPGVPPEVLDPRSTWADKAAYDRTANELAHKFAENYANHDFEAPPEVKASGPEPLA